MPIQVLQLETGDLAENCYFLWKDSASEALVFDPGDEASRLLDELKKRNLTPAAFVQTHCHCDHIGALTEMKAAFPAAPLYVPEQEKEWLKRPTLNLSYFMGGSITGPDPDILVNSNDVIEKAGVQLKAILVPGHSPGGTAYYVEDTEANKFHLICGDILFQGGIGRTDFPGSAGHEVLVEGIRDFLFCLPDETIVYPGHGGLTTIGEEKENNPFCGLG
jgi:glyoxylase-like metal-dependent hydrolase (beta-lactamase superfamily II)